MGESNCTIINTSSVNYFIECVFVYFMTCTVAKSVIYSLDSLTMYEVFKF